MNIYEQRFSERISEISATIALPEKLLELFDNYLETISNFKSLSFIEKQQPGLCSVLFST